MGYQGTGRNAGVRQGKDGENRGSPGQEEWAPENQEARGSGIGARGWDEVAKIEKGDRGERRRD